MLVLRYAATVALAVWVGGLIALGGIAAPATFDVAAARQLTDGRMLAGAIFGEALRRFHLVGYACGAVVLAVLVARGVLGPRPGAFGLRVAIVCLMLGASAWSGVVISGRIDRLRTGIGVAPSSLAESDPRRAAFGRLHAMSTALQLIPVLGGLTLLFFELKDPR